MIKKITELLLFMRQIFRIFKIFRAAAPNPAWGGGLTAPPSPNTLSWSKGRFAPWCAKRSMHLIFQKTFTNHPWPLTSYAPVVVLKNFQTHLLKRDVNETFPRDSEKDNV